jgi:hypothetical protein
MATTTHVTPVSEPSRPNPRKHPLLALKYVLFGYLPHFQIQREGRIWWISIGRH